MEDHPQPTRWQQFSIVELEALSVSLYAGFVEGLIEGETADRLSDEVTEELRRRGATPSGTP